MQTLEVTDEQYAFIQHLRDGILAEVVGKYGHVRECDAVQFLIDNFDGDVDADGDIEVDGALDSIGITDEHADDSSTEVSYDDGTADDGGGDSGDAADSDDGAASDDDMLDRMMKLLETHDDKWEDSPSADYRYRVELPDGTTEDVQTKDDVRALLFKHY